MNNKTTAHMTEETRDLLKSMRTPATPTIEAVILKLLEDKERDSILIEKLLQEREEKMFKR